MGVTSLEENSESRRFVDRELFREVIGHFTSGVTVITARHSETNFGITASAVASLSLDPPMLLFCINKKAGTRHAITESKAFAVNILHEDQGELAMRFAQPNTDKFAGVDFTQGVLGEPVLKNVLAYLECRVVEEVTGGTHSVFLAEVQNASAEEGTPLTYFRGRFGRFQAAEDESAYFIIRRLVLERKFQAGHILNITDLTTKLDLPRQAIYYAMTRVDSEGLITRVEGGNYIVNPLNAEALNEALDTRCALEVAAAERSVGRLSQQELAELEKRMNETVYRVEGNSASLDRYNDANTAFHDFIVALAKNATLLDSYRRLTAEAVMTSALRVALEAEDATAREELNTLAEDHIALTNAFKDSDTEEVKRIIRRHTEEAKRLGRYLIDSAGGRI